MEFHVSPISALCDTPLEIGAQGLSPRDSVTISACLHYPWAPDLEFKSSAHFRADDQGRIDLAKQAPESGDYSFVDRMGLIASLHSSDPNAFKKILSGIGINESMHIDFTAQHDGEQTTIQVERRFLATDAAREQIHDDFVGELFYSKDTTGPVIVWIGGSGSNLGINALICGPLASHGCAVLSLPFFNEPGLPKSLSHIPLEYFDKAIEWLAHHPATSGRPICLLGMSKGAEAALLVATRHPEISKVVLWAPNAWCFQGIALKNESSWTLGEKDLPYIRLKTSWLLSELWHCFVTNTPFGFTNVYRRGIERAKNRETARIPVERSHADFLLVAGDECGMWNTLEGSRELMDTLKHRNGGQKQELIVYQHTGEPYLVPYVIPCDYHTVRMAPRLTLDSGGSLEGNFRALVGAWERTLDFFGL
jgi:alpha-beta hydrolase superfamily lysophospholipase